MDLPTQRHIDAVPLRADAYTETAPLVNALLNCEARQPVRESAQQPEQQQTCASRPEEPAHGHRTSLEVDPLKASVRARAYGYRSCAA